ncbi:hypothetical protein HCEG_09340 [Histoplasma capsulatum var. duboisii H88]|uniref:Uncharacterized protein n=1 Tax=Ajellomyces capsulatus (strain H88) TaxID=544711 RepID=F0UW48_AJEC8|nr:hypothetical protein HCEG_09340 [Histoplasma capsulatum var. duboisii H88]
MTVRGSWSGGRIGRLQFIGEAQMVPTPTDLVVVIMAMTTCCRGRGDLDAGAAGQFLVRGPRSPGQAVPTGKGEVSVSGNPGCGYQSLRERAGCHEESHRINGLEIELHRETAIEEKGERELGISELGSEKENKGMNNYWYIRKAKNGTDWNTVYGGT